MSHTAESVAPRSRCGATYLHNAHPIPDGDRLVLCDGIPVWSNQDADTHGDKS